MKRIRIIALSICLLIILLGCQNPSNADNTSPFTIIAQQISVGTQYSNIGIAAFDTKFYKFVASGNGVHTIYLTGLGSDFSWTLFLYPNLLDPGIINELDDYYDSTDEIGDRKSVV